MRFLSNPPAALGHSPAPTKYPGAIPALQVGNSLVGYDQWPLRTHLGRIVLVTSWIIKIAASRIAHDDLNERVP